MSDKNDRSGASNVFGIGFFFLILGLALVVGGGYGVIQILLGGSNSYMVWLYPILIGGILIGLRLLWGTMVIIFELMK